MRGTTIGGAKRRWKGLLLAVVSLVIISMFGPLSFLLGFHQGFHSVARGNPILNSDMIIDARREYEQHYPSSHAEGTVGEMEMEPTIPEDFKRIENFTSNEVIDRDSSGRNLEENQVMLPPPPPPPRSRSHAAPPPPLNSNNDPFKTALPNEDRRDDADDIMNSCEARFGTYCLWVQKNKEKMRDSMVKKLKDLVFVARAYYPSISKAPAEISLSADMKLKIQELEHIFGECSTDADLPSQIGNKLLEMEATVSKAKLFPVDCNNVDKKLRQILGITEDEANFHMKQSIFLYQQAIQTMPKGLNCLFMNLTVEYFKLPLKEIEFSTDKFSDRTFQHYVIFSKNVLASSVVVNSTAMHAKESRRLVFHVLTDQQNYYAMKYWFLRHKYKDAVVQVLNIEDYGGDYDATSAGSKMSVPMEFRVSFSNVNNQPTEYVTTFSQPHYLLPEIFNSLEKVVVLGDDVVVQQDLSALWDLNMEGKVNGALQLCSINFGSLKSFFGKKAHIDETSCVWMSGLNVIDLARWRERDLTRSYSRFLQKVNAEEKSIESRQFAANLLTFEGEIYGLDGWVLSGLGHDYDINVEVVKTSPVLHYSGNMKPWLELGIQEYKPNWRKYLDRRNEHLTACNVNIGGGPES